MVPVSALVVDDHRELAEKVADILRGSIDGLSCHVASTGAEAMASTTEQLDLALIDIHLPDVNGVELMRELQERSPFAQMVVISGDASVESAISALDRGAFSYLIKPFSTAELVEKTQLALDRSRLLRERNALRVVLEESEQRHRNILESIPAFVVALDSRGNIQLWNGRIEHVTGFTRDEMIGEPGLHIVGDEDGDVRLPLKSGGHRLVRWRRADIAISPIAPPLTFAVGVDVTEEREVQRHAARTERLVAVGTLAAGLAHEVRNPLNSASLQLQVLERRLARGDAKPDALQNIVSIVHNEIRRLDRLVNEFLAFARPNPLNLGLIRLNDVIANVLILVRPECDAAGLSHSLELDPGVGQIQADEERLCQVFLNILRNAVEAMGEGGRLSVSTHGADWRGFVRVDIEDNGPGFPENAPVFDAFYTTKEHGTGLGLSIVHSIITDHGGSVQVESRPGRTRFSISLPQPAA